MDAVTVRAILMAMTTSGVTVAFGEKILIVCNKGEYAGLVNIAGLSGIGLSALLLVGKLLHALGTI